jgi:hypothetical protein
MFTIADEFGIYQASTLGEAERILFSDARPARLYLAETGKRIPHTIDGDLITYPNGIPGYLFLEIE